MDHRVPAATGLCLAASARHALPAPHRLTGGHPPLRATLDPGPAPRPVSEPPLRPILTACYSWPGRRVASGPLPLLFPPLECPSSRCQRNTFPNSVGLYSASTKEVPGQTLKGPLDPCPPAFAPLCDPLPPRAGQTNNLGGGLGDFRSYALEQPRQVGIRVPPRLPPGPPSRAPALLSLSFSASR